MGCCTSKGVLAYEDPALLASQTCFNEGEVKILYELFKKLSASLVDDGFISREEFQLGLFRNNEKKNLFVDRIFTLFDSKHDDLIDFDEFVRSLGVFHHSAPQSEKITFLFQIYDISQRGFIARDEVKKMIEALFQESDITVSDNIIDDIIDKTFEEADSKRDGKIDFEEWNELVAKNPSLLKNMTIPYLRDINDTFPSFGPISNDHID